MVLVTWPKALAYWQIKKKISFKHIRLEFRIGKGLFAKAPDGLHQSPHSYVGQNSVIQLSVDSKCVLSNTYMLTAS